MCPRRPRPLAGSIGQVVVVGGATMDLTSSPEPGRPLLRHTSNPGVVTQRPGGVGRNIAEAIARVAGDGGAPPLLVSAVGADLPGDALIADCKNAGVDTRGVRRDDSRRTAVYAAMLEEEGELLSAVADMEVMDSLSADDFSGFAPQIDAAPLVVADANLSPEVRPSPDCIPGRGMQSEMQSERDAVESMLSTS